MYRTVVLLSLPCLLLTACHSNSDTKSDTETHTKAKVVGKEGHLFDEASFTAALKTALPAVDTTDSVYRKRPIQTVTTALRLTYQLNGNHPLWLSENGITESSEQLLKDLDSLRWDGIDPARYQYTQLQTQCNAFKDGKAADLNACIAFDTLCTKAWLQASHDLLLGIIPSRKADSLWFHANDSTWYAAQLLASTQGKDGKYTPLSTYRSKIPTYSLLQAEYKRYHDMAANASLKQSKTALHNSMPDSSLIALIQQEAPWLQPDDVDSMTNTQRWVRSFQMAYGLRPTGKGDSATRAVLTRMPDTTANIITANMERLRWLPQQLESEYVIVNVPLMELFLRRNGNDDFHMRVVVGKPARQTPTLSADMANVVFNPSWGVPPTILKKEVLPGISRKGNGYLAKKGLHAYNRAGKMVSASSINAKNYRNFTFRQPPGARNALGSIKFNLPNKWDIYLHDTPHRDDFPLWYRAKSSGCIRVERPKDFAEYILSTLEGRNFDQTIIDSLIETRRTRFEILKHKIPVHIVYLTAFEDSTHQHIRYFSDVYNRDKKLIAALRY